MNQMSKIETVTTSDMDDRNVGVLNDAELETVVGGKAGGDNKQNYMVVKMTDCLITSVSL
jgi:hypothetical protein